MNLKSPPSHFPMHQISHDNDHELQFHHTFVPNRPSSLSYNFFFDMTQDHSTFFNHRQLYQPTHHIKAIKWMSSKMRVMQKLNETSDGGDRVSLETNDQKLQQPSSSDFSSNTSSYYNNSPIRVCSDCNTTKTPLWRSGPKGPKSLCNACGIRQRKARRAMAAAAAHGGDQIPVTKIKSQQKVKTGKNGRPKKRCKNEAESPSEGKKKKKKISFEDFLINLSKNLAFHRVLPDDEKDAAILLMALSSGLVNG